MWCYGGSGGGSCAVSPTQQFQLSEKVQSDEVFHFHKEIYPRKVHAYMYMYIHVRIYISLHVCMCTNTVVPINMLMVTLSLSLSLSPLPPPSLPPTLRMYITLSHSLLQVPSQKLLTCKPSNQTLAKAAAPTLPLLPTKKLTSNSSQSSLASSGSSTPVLSTVSSHQNPLSHQMTVSGALPTPSGAPPTTVASVVSINPQILQALLASTAQSASSSKPVVIPIQQSPVQTQIKTGTGTPTSTVVRTVKNTVHVRIQWNL